MSSSSVSLGAINPWSTQGSFNQASFAIQQALSKLQTATLVEVLSCSNDGGLSPFGFVSLQPLVNQVDGAIPPNTIPLPVLNNIPYFRMQGGTNAIIMDPQVGDIGIAVFASRDLSSVKANQGQSNPGSARQYDLSDGLYLGGVLNSTPTQYFQFNSDGITVLTPNKITLQSTGDTDITASGNANLTASGNVLISGSSIQAGSSAVPVVSKPFITWVTATLIPALATAGITVTAPPADSLTSTFGAS
jgi:hypothetical protein